MTTNTQATASQPSSDRRRSVARVVRAASRSWSMVSAWLGAGVMRSAGMRAPRVRVKASEANPPRSREFSSQFELGRPPEGGYGLPALEQIGAEPPGTPPATLGSTVRLFVAAIPPPALAQRLAETAAAIAPPELRVTPAQNLHITIHFLGEVSPDAVPALEADLAAAAVLHSPTGLTLNAITPGPPRRPRMLWATAKATPGYAAIVTGVAAATVPHAPNARPARPGTPHLTVARLRGRADMRRWPDRRPLGDAAFPLAELALVHSMLGKHGPTYSRLTMLPLGGQSGGRR